jgi:hypothetical protein
VTNAVGAGLVHVVGRAISYPCASIADLALSGGAVVNGTQHGQDLGQTILGPSIAENAHLRVAQVDGDAGLTLYADDPGGSRLAAFRRIGTPIFATDGAVNAPAKHLNAGDVAFYVSGSDLTFQCNSGQDHERRHQPDRLSAAQPRSWRFADTQDRRREGAGAFNARFGLRGR